MYREWNKIEFPKKYYIWILKQEGWEVDQEIDGKMKWGGDRRRLVGGKGCKERVYNKRGIEEAPENGKEMSHSARANGMNGATALVGQGLLIIEDSRSHSVRHTKLGRTPLEEWSAWRKDICLTTHNIHTRQTSMPQRDSNPQSSKQVAADPCLRLRGHWDWQEKYLDLQNVRNHSIHDIATDTRRLEPTAPLIREPAITLHLLPSRVTSRHTNTKLLH